MTNSLTLFGTKVDRAAVHIMFFFFLIWQYLSGTVIYRNGTTCSTDLGNRSGEIVSYTNNQCIEVQ
jgi:hypothetical protein